MIFSGKICNKCNQHKVDYHKDKSKKDGLCTICSDCKKKNTGAWRKENTEKGRKNSLDYYYYKKNDPDFIKSRNDYSKKWREENKDKHCAKEARRRASKIKATPNWLTDKQKHQIGEIYTLCKIITEETREQHHVDHIVPLKGKNVCGLHVPWNLQIIPAKENLSKGNRL